VRDQVAGMAEITSEPSPFARGVAIGVESGELISGSIGSRLISRLDYTVLGAAVTTAALLQSIAAKDQILIGEALYQHVHEAVECARIEPPAPSGRARPGAGYAVLAVRAAATPLAESETVLIEESLVQGARTAQLPETHDAPREDPQT
jgi:class 3 adenylate cyclase